MFVHLRQDLERVRNLCYMVSRREKIFRSYVRIKNEILEKQVEILSNSSFKLTAKDVEEVMKARIGDSLYDKFYCVELEEDKKEDIAIKSSTSMQKAPNPYAKSYSNSIYTRSRRHTTSQSMTDNCDDSCDNEHLDMPKLVKCKSEENVNTLETNNSEQSFTHSPFVIKIAPKQNENDIKSNVEHISDLPIVEDTNASPDKEAHDISFKSTVESHEAHLNPENGAKVKKIVSSNEGSNDKHSLCLSDKENINGHTPVKLKKVRGQVEVRHTELKSAVQEFVNQKSDLYDDDNSLGVANEISSSEGKKNFKIDKRSTRYQMRTRYYSTDNMESIETPFKSTDTTEAEIISPNPDDSTANSPSNCSDTLSFLTQDSERTEQEKQPVDSTPVPIQRKRRGRPRKILHPNETSIMNFSVIKDEDVLGNEKNSLCSDIIELSNSNESSGFKMALRHSREHISVKSGEQKQKNKRSVVVKLDHLDAVPLKEANKDILNETVGAESEHTRSSSEWDNEGTSPPRHNSVEQPASTRIIIRLRKDPNRESWKNDSCSSSDVPVAFRIVRNDLDVNCESSMSEFHSVIKNSDSRQNQTYSVRNDSENKHRYLMRERSVTPRNIKCTFGRS
ncbi:PHD finger protein rhinocero, partial [Stegodyphus mimosarum]